jgi:NADPH:quinone reductase-like Zn-dependent oxidoreductase
MPLWVLARDAHGNLTNGAGRELPGVGDGGDHGDHGGDGGDGGDGGIEVHVIGGEGRAMQVHRIAAAGAFARDLLPLIADGRLRPRMDQVVAFDRLPTAKAVMDGNRHGGKRVVTMA